MDTQVDEGRRRKGRKGEKKTGRGRTTRQPEGRVKMEERQWKQRKEEREERLRHDGER